jgi:CheY-like chemotaxis protein
MKKANMLLGDDDAEVLAALSAAFASEDYDVVIAKNGREAIERMREHRFARSQHASKGRLGSRRAANVDPPVAAGYRYNGAAGPIPAGRCRRSRRTDGKASGPASLAAHD